MTTDALKVMLNKAKYVTVSILDNKYVACIRRVGPIKSVTIPVEHYNFLLSQNFNLKLEKCISQNGMTLNIPPSEEVYFAPIKTEATKDDNFVKYEEQPEKPQVNFGEDSVTSNDLISRSIDPEDNSLIILEKSEYENYSRNALLEFLNIIPDEVITPEIKNEISPDNYQSRNLSKKRCLQIIDLVLFS